MHEVMQRWAEIVEQPGTEEVLWSRIADGETLQAIAKAWAVPTGRMVRWVLSDPDRTVAYKQAQEAAAHALIAEVVAIADDDASEVARAKLRIETRFKVAAAHARDRYGMQSGSGPTQAVQVIVQREAKDV